MVKALLLLIAAAGPLWLAYLFGFWMLLGFAALAAATLLVSNGKARGIEETEGGRLTGYTTTSYTDI